MLNSGTRENELIRKAGRSRHVPAYKVVITLFTHSMLILIFLGFITYILPRFQEVLADLDVELPLVTQRVIEAGRFVQTHFYIVGPGSILFLLVDIMVYVQLLRGGQRGLAFLWSTLILLAGAGAILLTFAATLMPVYTSNLDKIISG